MGSTLLLRTTEPSGVPAMFDMRVPVIPGNSVILNAKTAPQGMTRTKSE
jgi:hypothetical protein